MSERQGKIAVIVVGYNRPDSLRRILQSLAKAQYDYTEIPLRISIDHSGMEEVVRAAEEFEWKHGEKKVVYHPRRLGLRSHIISCGDLTEEYGAVMILEDDLYVSPDYYNFAAQALEKYGVQIALYKKAVAHVMGVREDAVRAQIVNIARCREIPM